MRWAKSILLIFVFILCIEKIRYLIFHRKRWMEMLPMPAAFFFSFFFLILYRFSFTLSVHHESRAKPYSFHAIISCILIYIAICDLWFASMRHLPIFKAKKQYQSASEIIIITIICNIKVNEIGNNCKSNSKKKIIEKIVQSDVQYSILFLIIICCFSWCCVKWRPSEKPYTK